MKPGDLVCLSADHLAYELEGCKGSFGLLLEYTEIPGKGDKIFPAWKTLWANKRVLVYQTEISLVGKDVL